MWAGARVAGGRLDKSLAKAVREEEADMGFMI